MEQFFNSVTSINDALNGFIWGKVGLILLICTGILMTVITKCFQVSHFGHWIKNTIGSIFDRNVIRHSKDKRSISPFQALCTALAATVGTGNIAGVAAAVCVGGAGAVFWMWVAAFFGMMTNYSENVLGIYYRRRNENGEWSGGAMYYLSDGLGSKKGCKWVGKILAVLFSCFAILASFGIGSMAQINKIVLNIQSAFPVKSLENIEIYSGVTLYALIIGVVIALLAALIILGGLKRIASFAEKVVPFMVIAFIVGGIVIVGINYNRIIPAFAAIFNTAFTPLAAVGGVGGFALKRIIDGPLMNGFKRGVFSNEAGLGSSVMVHSNSSVKEPVKQGMWGIFEVFVDTIIVCTLTALVVLTSGVYNLSTGAALDGATDATLVASAYNSVFSFGDIGAKFVAVAMFLFAFTTVLGWSHYGAKAWEYLFGSKSTVIFKVIHILTMVMGAVLTTSLAWDISDTFNGFMMVPNLIGLVVLSPLVMKITKNYIVRKVRKPGAQEVKPMYNFNPETQLAEEQREEA